MNIDETNLISFSSRKKNEFYTYRQNRKSRWDIITKFMKTSADRQIATSANVTKSRFSKYLKK